MKIAEAEEAKYIKYKKYMYIPTAIHERKSNISG